jgi:type IV secretion system protein VirB10
MSQNIPPNQPGYGQDPNQQEYAQPGVSPYGYQQQAAAPDLDANAPTLKSDELQRLNRKGLFFLAGFVLLILVMVALFLSRATSDDEADVSKPKEETVFVPELPKAAEPAPPVEPIELVEQPTVVLPPQLPPQPEGYSDPAGPAEPQGPTGPTLMDRRMGVTGTEASQQTQDPVMQALLAQAGLGPANAQEKSESSQATSAQFLNNADSLLVRGTYIRCVLETRIITDVPGFTSCIVTEPVYSINGRRLLLPKGSKISGSYNSEDPKFPRVSVVWDRITTPNGIDITMASPGVDNLGSAGHVGQYNSHWGSKISSALLISLLSDAFKYAGEKNGPQTNSVTTGGVIVSSPFKSNTAQSMQKIAEQVVDRNLSRPATVTVNQGTVVNVYVAKDVSFAGVVAR